MVKCAAYNCEVRSDRGEKVSMFLFPKEFDLCKKWVEKLKTVETFWPSKYSKLCVRHFTNDQFAMDPELARQAGYSKLELKKGAIPSIFDYGQKRKDLDDKMIQPKKAARSSKAHIKRRALQTLKSLETDNTVITDEDTIPVSPVTTDIPLTDEPSTKCVQAFTQTPNINLQPRISKRHVCAQTDILVTRPNVTTRTVETQTEVIHLPEDLNESLYSLDDSITADPDWTPLLEMSHEERGSDDYYRPAKERKFIVFESALDKLFDICNMCGKNVETTKTVKGTFLNMQSVCACGNRVSWDSQPQSGTMPLGNLILAAAILFAGCCVSKALNLFRHAAVQIFTLRTYHNIQSSYLVPSVTSIWQLHQLKLYDDIKNDGNPLVVGGDARCCSPGHTAKYGSYSIMDLSTSKILDIQLVQSNEVKNSYSMELEGLKRCLAHLVENELEISHLVTDRHSQVKKYMSTTRPDVQHWFDCWHVAKGIFKKLEHKGKKRSCAILLSWARSISNHLYWCASSSEGDGDLVHDKWISILNHVADTHEGHQGKFQECLHGPLEDRDWIKKESIAFSELHKVVKGNLLLKDIKKLSPAEQTSSLESFHRVVCHFAPKLVHFFHPQMEARLYIAALHFNENGNRQQRSTQDGTPMYSVSFPKSRKGEGIAKEIKVQQTYDYIDELMEEVVLHREVHKSYSRAKTFLQFDKQRPAPLSHSTPRRPKQEIIDKHVSRFNIN